MPALPECQARGHPHPATPRWLHCCGWGTKSESCNWCREYRAFRRGESLHLPCRPAKMLAFLLDRLSQFAKLSMIPHAAMEEMKSSLQAFFGPTDLHPTCRGQGGQGFHAALPPTLRSTPRIQPISEVSLAGSNAEVRAQTMPASLPPKVIIARGHDKVKAYLLLGCQPASSCSKPYEQCLPTDTEVPLAEGRVEVNAANCRGSSPRSSLRRRPCRALDPPTTRVPAQGPSVREDMKDSLQAFLGPTDLHPTCRGLGGQGLHAVLQTTQCPTCRGPGEQDFHAILPPTLRSTPRT